MDATKDLRSCQRADCNANLIFSLFNQNVGRTGFLVNCSETGLLFTTDSPLKTGATVFIRLSKAEDLPPGSAVVSRPRSVCVAEVRWCHEEKKGHGTRYMIGAKYLIPV